MKSTSMRFHSFITAGVLIVGIMIVSIESKAQENGNLKTTEERAKAMTERMKTDLSLTDDQYVTVEAINRKYAQKNEQLIKSDAGKFSKYRSLKSSRGAKNKEMKKVLSREQFKKYRQLIDERKSEAKKAFRDRQG